MNKALEQAEFFLKRAIDFLGYGKAEYEMLRRPDRIIEVKIPVKRKDGSVEVFVGWRSQHNNALGPYKGGIRYHPEVTKEEVIALSMIMTFKNSLAGLPYGGGKGGIRVNPKELTKEELEQLSRNFFRAINRYVGIDIDIPAPDVYTNPQTMAWYFDEYSKVRGEDQFFGVVTGKPKLLGGLDTRVISTGYGTALAARLAAEKLWGSVQGKTVAVQGFGNVGRYAAKYLAEWGAIVVAVSDSSGGIFNSKGLNVDEVLKVKDEKGKVTAYENIERKITNEELLELDVDILVPSALEDVITPANMRNIKAKIISEGANGPVSNEADEFLFKEKDMVVIPDILANAGGVITSHIEWVNNRMGGWIREEDALQRLTEKMTEVFNKTWEFWEKDARREVPMRIAAYSLAVKRVVEAMKMRGWL